MPTARGGTGMRRARWLVPCSVSSLTSPDNLPGFAGFLILFLIFKIIFSNFFNIFMFCSSLQPEPLPLSPCRGRGALPLRSPAPPADGAPCYPCHATQTPPRELPAPGAAGGPGPGRAAGTWLRAGARPGGLPFPAGFASGGRAAPSYWSAAPPLRAAIGRAAPLWGRGRKCGVRRPRRLGGGGTGAPAM